MNWRNICCSLLIFDKCHTHTFTYVVRPYWFVTIYKNHTYVWVGQISVLLSFVRRIDCQIHYLQIQFLYGLINFFCSTAELSILYFIEHSLITRKSLENLKCSQFFVRIGLKVFFSILRNWTFSVLKVVIWTLSITWEMGLMNWDWIEIGIPFAHSITKVIYQTTLIPMGSICLTKLTSKSLELYCTYKQWYNEL